MTVYEREFQDEDCGCSWRRDPIARLCQRCAIMRHEADEERRKELEATDED